MDNELNRNYGNNTTPNAQKNSESKQKINSTITTGQLEKQGRAKNYSVGRPSNSKIGSGQSKDKSDNEKLSQSKKPLVNNSFSQNGNSNKRTASNSVAPTSKRGKIANILLQNLQKSNMMINAASRLSKAKNDNKNENSNMKDRISKVIKKRALMKNPLLGKFLGTADKENSEKEDENENLSDGGMANFKIAYKVIVAMSIIGGPVFILVVFIVCMVTASHVFLTANELGHADDVRDDEAEKNIDKVKDDEEKLDEEQEDDSSESNDNSVSYTFDIFLDEDDEENIHYEFVKSNYRPTQEASLEDLEDFYPEIVNYTNDQYNTNDVYKFFKKLYNIYNYYNENYKVKLDTALIMSVLKMQSDDMAVVFKSNTVDYNENDTSNFSVDKDWSSYKSTKDNSAHDIEVLAQAMVKKKTSSGSGSDNSNSSSGDVVVSKTGKEAIDKLNEIALKQVGQTGDKYESWYNVYADWCAIFVSWLFNQIDGLDKYIVSSAVAGEIPRSSDAQGLGKWYEDECTDSSTVPRAGDIILYDPWIGSYTIPYPDHGSDKYYSSHIGYVYAVDDENVYSVEGNGSLGGYNGVWKHEHSRKYCGSGTTQGITGYFRPNY